MLKKLIPAQRVQPCDDVVALSQSNPMPITSAPPGIMVEYLDLGQLAALLHISKHSAYRLVTRRLLPVYRICRKFLFRRADIERLLETRRQAPRDPLLWQ